MKRFTITIISAMLCGLVVLSACGGAKKNVQDAEGQAEAGGNAPSGYLMPAISANNFCGDFTTMTPDYGYLMPEKGLFLKMHDIRGAYGINIYTYVMDGDNIQCTPGHFVMIVPRGGDKLEITIKKSSMKNTPSFTFIPTPDTIQSVISQTYHHVEYIIIDGASKDKTLSIADRYKEHIAQVVSEPDKGLYDAMNKGIRLATGDYLCFLNAGDSFHEDDTLQQMVHTLTGNQLPDVLYGETALVDKEGHFIRMRRLSAPETLAWKSFKQGMLVCHQAFFAKRSLVEPYNLKYRFSADFDWCIRIMKKAQRLHNTHLTIIDYLEEGMTTQNRKASLKERFRIMAQHYGLISTVAHHAWFVLRAVLKK